MRQGKLLATGLIYTRQISYCMKTRSLLSQAVNCPLIPIHGPHVTDCTEALNSRSQERREVWRHVTTVALFLDDNKTNDDGDAKENGKKMFVLTNNNFARESRYFVHFFAIVAPLRQGVLQLKCYYDQIWEFVFDYIFRKCM